MTDEALVHVASLEAMAQVDLRRIWGGSPGSSERVPTDEAERGVVVIKRMDVQE